VIRVDKMMVLFAFTQNEVVECDRRSGEDCDAGVALKETHSRPGTADVDVTQ